MKKLVTVSLTSLAVVTGAAQAAPTVSDRADPPGASTQATGGGVPFDGGIFQDIAFHHFRHEGCRWRDDNPGRHEGFEKHERCVSP